MKLAVRPVTTDMASAAVRSKRFTMQTTAVSLRLTIEGMYSDKVLAVIRELISNAVDAHADAGRSDVPIKVHLPTELEPHFSVRDYGTSMTDEKIWEVYTEVFNSDKSASNELTGAFGLGSKSPFAIGDSFVATAYLDGEARVYVASFDDEGYPVLHHLSTTPTDEPDGFEVSLTPAESLRHQFLPKLRSFVRGLDVAPVTNVELNTPEPVLSGNGWKVFETDRYTTDVKVRQGAVVYPTGIYNRYFNSDHELVVDVPIGSVEVATSREAVVLDDDSTLLIRTLVDHAQQAVIDQIAATIEAAPTYFEANAAYNRLSGVLNDTPRVLYGPNEMTVSGRIHTRVDVTYSLTKRGTAPRTGFTAEVTPGKPGPVPTFIIDTPGDTTPRKRLRIAKAGRDRSAYVLHDPTPAQVKALIRAYRRTDNFIHVSKLADVEVKRKPRAASAEGVTGVYTPSSYDRLGRVLSDPAPGSYIAVPIQAIKVTTKVLSENPALRSTQDDLGPVFTALANHFGKPVLLLSASGMKRLKPKTSDLIDAHIDRFVKAKLPGYKADLRFSTISAATLHGRSVTESLLGEKAPARVSFAWQFDRLEAIRTADTEVVAAAEAEIAELTERFPLVFKSNEDAVLSYIKLLKEETK
jgi:hypothetical protein